MQESSSTAPAELAKLSSLAIVARVVAEPSLVKLAGAIFESRATHRRAAEALAEAYASGKAPPWMTAYLLGCMRASAMYSVVRAILVSAPGLLAESYAGVALVKISGDAAREDLLALLAGPYPRACRDGAMIGLAALRDPSLVGPLLVLVRTGQIPTKAAAHIIAADGPTPEQLVGWLGSAEASERSVALRVIVGTAKVDRERKFDPAVVQATRQALVLGSDLPEYLSTWLRQRLSGP